MKFYVAVTDPDWFDYQKNNRFEEINFWAPSSTGLTKLDADTPFLFKLKKTRSIVGGGYFQLQGSVLMDYAWQAFGSSNGSPDRQSFYNKLSGKVGLQDGIQNFHIGYRVLTNPFFFDPGDYIDVSNSFSQNIVRGKTYDTEHRDARELWHQVRKNLDKKLSSQPAHLRVEETSWQRGRIGQGGFRLAVAENYHHRCLITGERTIPVLEAAHITPYSKGGPNELSNGLFLRRDIHALFDSGLVTITPDMNFQVSPLVDKLYNNGKIYYAMEGSVQLPKDAASPSGERLEQHYREVYRKG